MLEQLASASQICPLPPGVDVVVQGAPAHAFYAVIDGRVVVHRDGQEVAHLAPGDWFGERGLLDSAPRNATVTTEEQTTVLRLEGARCSRRFRSAPTMLSAIDLSNNAPAAAPAIGPNRPRGRSDVEQRREPEAPSWSSSAPATRASGVPSPDGRARSEAGDRRRARPLVGGARRRRRSPRVASCAGRRRPRPRCEGRPRRARRGRHSTGRRAHVLGGQRLRVASSGRRARAAGEPARGGGLGP